MISLTKNNLKKIILEEYSRIIYEQKDFAGLIEKYRSGGLTKDIIQIFAPNLLKSEPNPQTAKSIASIFNRIYNESSILRKKFNLINPQSAMDMLNKNYKETIQAMYESLGNSELRTIIKNLANKPDLLKSLIMAISGDVLKQVADRLNQSAMDSYEWNLHQAYSKGDMGKFVDANPLRSNA